MWLKIKQGVRRFWSMFPLTRVPFWYRFFEPQPVGTTSKVVAGHLRILMSDILRPFGPMKIHTPSGFVP